MPVAGSLSTRREGITKAVNTPYMDTNGAGSAPAGGRGLTKGQVRLYQAGAFILVAGLCGSAWIYRRAAGRPDTSSAIPGVQDTKIDQFRMELYGGKANILANDLQSWFDSLWQGRHLAFSLAILATVIGLGCILLAEQLPRIPAFPPADYDRRDGFRNSDGLTAPPPADTKSPESPNPKKP